MNLIYQLKAYLIKKKRKDSYDAHNAEYISEWKLENVLSVHEDYEKTNVFNHPTMRFHDIISENKWINIAIDIWSWAGFISNKLSWYFPIVYWIEPSSGAIELAKQATKNDKIHWINNFAERWLNEIISKYDEPIFFLTSTVLSHLEDNVVSDICKSLKNAKVGSILVFAEVFGDTKHQHLWHIRTKQWWQAQLPWWEIDFFGPEVKYSLLWARCNKWFSWKKLN